MGTQMEISSLSHCAHVSDKGCWVSLGSIHHPSMQILLNEGLIISAKSWRDVRVDQPAKVAANG